MYPDSVSHKAQQLEQLVRETAAFIRTSFGKVRQDQIEIKELNSLVSYVDKKAEELLVQGLLQIIPDSVFITEENTVEQEHGEEVWIIDPLDGTTNFLYGIPHFSISVALKVRDEIILGVVFDVMREESFMAFANNGAFLNGKRIFVRNNNRMDEAVIATGFPYKRVEARIPFSDILNYFLTKVRAIRRMGSAALDLAYVAAGRMDAYYECCLNPWDVAAGILLVKEAGGVVSDFKGETDCEDGEQVIAGTAKIHEAVLSGIQEKLSDYRTSKRFGLY